MARINFPIIARGNNKSNRAMMTMLSDMLKDDNYISQARKKYRPFLKAVGIIDNILPWQEIVLYMVLDGKITLKEKHE